MLIDNLKDINSPADLFLYIANVETELEEVKKHRDMLLTQLDIASNKISDLSQKLMETEHTLEFYESKMTVKKEFNND